MRRAVALLLVCVGARAAAGELHFGGYLNTALQLGLFDCGGDANACRFLDFKNTNVFGLTLEARPSSTVEIAADVAVRNLNFATVHTLDDTGDSAKVQPVSLRLKEAKVELRDLFGLRGLDLSIGALRFAWGTADGINPLDRVNPFDLEDGAGFDKRLASPALQLAYTIGPVRIEVVALPLFTPAVLPIAAIDLTGLGNPGQVFTLNALATGTPPEVRKIETPTTTPAAALENVGVAARVVWNSPVGAFAASFFRGHDSLPQASGDARLSGYQTQNRVDLGVPLLYPRLMFAGVDWRGPLWRQLSGWVELAVLFPERHALSISEAQLRQLQKLGQIKEVPSPLPTQGTQGDDVMVHAVTGLEYLFDDIVYLNVQYARGLPIERQASDVHNYVLALVRVMLLEGRLELDARGAIEVSDTRTLGYQAGGSVSWLHGDVAKLSLGCTFLGGQDGATFARLGPLSHLRIALESKF